MHIVYIIMAISYACMQFEKLASISSCSIAIYVTMLPSFGSKPKREGYDCICHQSMLFNSHQTILPKRFTKLHNVVRDIEVHRVNRTHQ